MNRREWLSSTAVLGASSLVYPIETFQPFQVSVDRKRNSKVNLGANENPYGPSENARKVIQENIIGGNRYPNELRKQLIDELALKFGVSNQSVLLGAGSSDLLQVLACWCIREKLHLTTSELTFDLLPTYVKRFGGQMVKTKLTTNMGLDLKSIETSSIKNPGLVYLVNPNNPTGSKLDYGDLLAFCKRVSKHSYIIVDEAYIEYVPNNESVISLINDNPKIIVVRTFSKIYGLAGLRVGYALANPKIASTLRSYQVWSGASLNNLGIAAAIASLSDINFVQESRLKNLESRRYTLEELRKLNRFCVEPYGNFIWFKCDPFEVDINRMYAENNIEVRAGKINGETWMRVTIGRKETMQRFIKVAKSIWT